MSFLDKIIGRQKNPQPDERAEIEAAENYFRNAPRDVLERWPYLHPALFAHAVWRAGAVVSILDATPGDLVLDFGAGNGWVSLMLNRCGVRAALVDVASGASELARETFEKDPLARKDVETLFPRYDGKRIEMDDGSCDRAIAIDALHHLPDTATILREIFRLLRDGGKFAIADVGAGHSRSAPAKFEMKHYGIVERDIDASRIAEQALAAGFTSAKIYPLPAPGAVVFDRAMRERFLKGETSLLPPTPFADALAAGTFMLFEKGVETKDSRHPGLIACEIKAKPSSIKTSPGAIVEVELSVGNTGDTLWLAQEKYGRFVKPAARLYDESGKVVTFDHWSGRLVDNVVPGGKTKIIANVPMPVSAGRWRIEFDLKIGDFWFEGYGSTPVAVEIEVS